jgi:5-methyltetrahydropteroyltriglutamate--homocysteine methyltransferase
MGPVTYKDPEAIQRDIDRFTAALQGVEPAETFMTAASPGVIAGLLHNQYYPSYEAYLEALAEAMKPEYTAIHRAGFLLQIDAPDLASSRHLNFAQASLEEWRRTIAFHVEVLNAALTDIPRDTVRLHLCWGNYEGPHHRDVELKDMIDIALTANVGAISIEGANPRHAHEWKVFQEVKLPGGMLLIPGVIDSTTNFIEHPELVAERIVRFATLLGRENVMGGVDCGFSSNADFPPAVASSIIWAKLQSLAEGARIASEQLW